MRARTALLALLLWAGGAAQAETRNELWPELDAYFKTGERTRLFLFASLMHAGESLNAAGVTSYQDAEFGVHLDVTLAPIFRPALMEADWERDRYLWMRVGYSRSGELGASSGSYAEDRGIFELHTRIPLPPANWIFARLRWEARDIEGLHADRYRIRLGAEREVTLFERIVVPYLSAEVYYDTRYDQWNRQQYKVGADIAINDRWRIEPYLVRQNDERSQPAHVNALGLMLKYFR